MEDTQTLRTPKTDFDFYVRPLKPEEALFVSQLAIMLTV